jgi:hypothetical protein
VLNRVLELEFRSWKQVGLGFMRSDPSLRYSISIVGQRRGVKRWSEHRQFNLTYAHRFYVTGACSFHFHSCTSPSAAPQQLLPRVNLYLNSHFDHVRSTIVLPLNATFSSVVSPSPSCTTPAIRRIPIVCPPPDPRNLRTGSLRNGRAHFFAGL